MYILPSVDTPFEAYAGRANGKKLLDKTKKIFEKGVMVGSYVNFKGKEAQTGANEGRNFRM